MNIVQLQEQLKNFSQDQLVREMQMPSGSTPQFLVLGEIMRRQKMQQDFTAQKAKSDSQGTVADDAIAAAGVPQGGIADMARALAPKTDMAQSTGVQAMADGGRVRKMQEGRRVYTDPSIIAAASRMGMSVDDYLKSIGNDAALVPPGLSPAENRDAPFARPSGFVEGTGGVRYSGNLTPNALDAVLAAQSANANTRIAQDAAAQDKMLRSYMYEVSPTATYPSAYEQMLAESAAAPVGLSETQKEELTAYSRKLTPEEEAVVAWRGKALDTLGDWAGTAGKFAYDYGVAPLGSLGQLGTGALLSGASKATGLVPGLEGASVDLGKGSEAAFAAAEELQAEPASAEGPAFERTGRSGPAPTPEEIAAAQQAAAEAGVTPPAAETPTETPTAPATTTASTGGTGAGGAGGAGGGGVSSYEQELLNILGRREKASEQDKWLALAQVGLNMMSSTQPTVLGAIGEAGVKGVEAARTARDQYDKDRLELLGMLEQSRMARAAAAARAARGGGGGGGISPLQAAKLELEFMKYGLDVEEANRAALADDLDLLYRLAPDGAEALAPGNQGFVDNLRAKIQSRITGAGAVDPYAGRSHDVTGSPQ